MKETEKDPFAEYDKLFDEMDKEEKVETKKKSNYFDEDMHERARMKREHMEAYHNQFIRKNPDKIKYTNMSANGSYFTRVQKVRVNYKATILFNALFFIYVVGIIALVIYFFSKDRRDLVGVTFGVGAGVFIITMIINIIIRKKKGIWQD
eukprot:Anaeramoba_ignava/a91042_11.p2 GENE.a91042_11~~a91042_11.p2  ORF type:complete len:150 (-),score=10.39 a91042_11:143-592(-)